MESLGRLAANVSHEIKNALQPIRLMLENLEDIVDMTPEQAARCVTVAIENMDIAESIVKDVLHYSRRNGNEKEPVSTQELIKNIDRFSRNLLPKTAQFELSVAPELESSGDTCVAVHQNGIFQITTNLINNALDAMEHKGAIALEFSLCSLGEESALRLPAGKYLQASFADNGEGIPEHAIENIFQPFFSTKTPGMGTGLGLAMAKRIALDHNGNLIAENKSNNGGAVFTLLLPMMKA